MKKLTCIVYWLISLTWGILLTFVGFLVAVFSVVFLKGKLHRNGFSFIVEVGSGSWGGICIGAFALCYRCSETNPDYYEHVRRHEFGHSVQHLIFGPLQLFIVEIPSAIRYWKYRLHREDQHEPYDAIWFERTASEWGHLWINKIEEVDVPYVYGKTF